MKFQHFALPAALLTSAALPGAAARTPPPAPTDVFSRAVVELNGRSVPTAGYENTLDGFDAYLRASGVRRVSAADLTTPHHRELAAQLGFAYFLPPKEWWPRGAALALLAENLSQAAGDRIQVRNWWRPPAYNSHPGVGGARNGDHPTANALDVDYSGQAARMRAEIWLRHLSLKFPWMGLSLGLGPQTTHVGIGSPKGHREWHYAGWTPAR